MNSAKSGLITVLSQLHRLIFVLAFAFLLAACGGGSSGGDSSGAGDDSGPQSLSNIPIMYSNTPTQDKELTISLMTDDDIGDIDWTVVSQPDTANLAISTSDDTKSISVIPRVAGEYRLQARLADSGSQRHTNFTIRPVFPFNEAKIEGYDGVQDIRTIKGRITNQSWVNSATLSQSELQTIVSAYPPLMVVGYDPLLGLLVEYDDAESTNLEALEEIRTQPGIGSVRNRFYRGEESVSNDLVIPDDGSRFDNGGDNWHLEQINAPEAWNYTTGSEDIVVGISEGAYALPHEELEGQYLWVHFGEREEFRTREDWDSGRAHGNATAGSVGALTDNPQGVSAVNWKSPMYLGPWLLDGVETILAQDDVVVVNKSWGYPIPKNFNPNNPASAESQRNQSISRFQDFREQASANPDVLLVRSAGNGIGNGKGNNGVYGVDAVFGGGAIHYDDAGLLNSGTLRKMPNVLVVAAMLDDQRLAHYSNYGVSVDIAAPTAYRSLALGLNEFWEDPTFGRDGGYTGTSAAAPVVTGVASLIYSMYPGFTGQEVRDILVNSATEFVAERYVAPDPAGADNDNIESLEHQIPILNAANALEMAREIIDGKVRVSHVIFDPFAPRATLDFASIDPDLVVESVSWELEASTDGGASWNSVDGRISEPGGSVQATLDTEAMLHRASAEVRLRNPETEDEVFANREYAFTYAPVSIVARDTVTLAPLSNVEISVEFLGGGAFGETAFTDGAGRVEAFLDPGMYKIRGIVSGYQEAVTLTSANILQSSEAVLNLTAIQVGAVGSIGGKVVDLSGNPVVGATVRISGGEQTNGFFASAITDSEGAYNISNIAKTDSNGAPIEAFILEASAFGFGSVVKETVIVLAGKERTENFTLVAQEVPPGVLFADDFEQDLGGWSATGFWNRIDLSSDTIFNTLLDAGYTALAPDEPGPRASLPQASSGDFSWWYGEPDTGTFIGTQSPEDFLLSGGTSTEANSGRLTSPVISLPATSQPLLRFMTWWEIESVNPNEFGFDIMELQMSTDGGASFQTIRRLNPFVDPSDSDREPKPFSSAGYNRRPVWVLEEIDLTDYAGETVIFRFAFDTNDELYNGFRGWIIDDFEVIDVAVVPEGVVGVQGVSDNRGDATMLDSEDFGVPSKEFWSIHKKPGRYQSDGPRVR